MTRPAKRTKNTAAPEAANRNWQVSTHDDDDRFVTVVVTDKKAGTSLRYRVRRDPLEVRARP